MRYCILLIIILFFSFVLTLISLFIYCCFRISGEISKKEESTHEEKIRNKRQSF